MYFEIVNASGGYRAHAKGDNHELVWWTEVYTTKATAQNAIEGLDVGSEAGNIWFLRNLHPQGLPSRWATPQLLQADGKSARRFLYRHKNLQGPEELLIGYSNPTVEDWDLDGDLDIVAGCHGETYYLFENVGTRTQPSLTFRGPLRHGDGIPVSCAWRTRPGVGDVTGDGLPDLVGVDGKRLLTLWRRYRDARGELRLRAPEYPVSLRTTSPE